jgi:hypothetical protein
MNAAAIVTLLLGLLDRASAIGQFLTILQTEKRDATPEEWAALLQADDAARIALVQAIAQAKVEQPSGKP